MIIKLEKVIPHALENKLDSNSQIWNQSLTFNQEEIYLIKAISGSGKSTFINALYGIRKDYEGNIFYDDLSIKSLSDDLLSPFRLNNLSIVFQNLRLFEHLTARENLLLSSPKNSYLTDELINWSELLKVDSLLDKKVAILSYGERQRFSILRALSKNFQFLFLDEPYSHLDKSNALAAHELILTVASKNKAGIILTSLGNEDFIQPSKTLLL